MFNFKWFLVDDCTTTRGMIWEIALSAKTAKEAEETLRTEWNSLTPTDQGLRDYMYVVEAAVDSDGSLNWDFVIDIVGKRVRRLG